MSSSIRSRRTTSNRVSLDSGASATSQEAVRELKEEFRRSLLNTDRAICSRNLRPSEIAAEKERLGVGIGHGGDGDAEGVDDDVDGSLPDSAESGGFDLYGFLASASSDNEEEDAEDAALLLNMPIEESKQIKYVFKKAQGCVL